MNRYISDEDFPEEYEQDQWEMQQMQADMILHDVDKFDEYETWMMEFRSDE